MNTGGAWLPGRGGQKQLVRFGFVGSPDIYGYMVDGTALFVEVKKPSGKVSPEQAAFIEEANRHGCIAFVARGIDDVARNLNERFTGNIGPEAPIAHPVRATA